jgi:hypothetical protein
VSAAGTAMLSPLVWPPTSQVNGRWLQRALAALVVELDACWTAHELARCLDETLDGESLAERLSEVVSAAVVCHDTGEVIALLDTCALGAAAHLRAAVESRRRALGTLRDVAWLARGRLLDRPRLRSVLGEVIADLATAGRFVVAADRALLDSGRGCCGVAQRRE